MGDRSIGDQRPSIDWSSVFADLTYLGLTQQDLSDRLGVRASLVARLADGRHRPAPLIASRAASLWVHVTGKPVGFIPRQSRPQRSVIAQVGQTSGDLLASNAASDLIKIVRLWICSTKATR
jgi:transcriptional regulator with XRE-family HTH domain